MNRNVTIALMLGWQDVRQAYRRSAVGPFWITGGMAIQIVTMGLVFGLIFKSNVQEYLPFLSVSIILWGFISNGLTEGCLSFINGEAMIRQLKLPIYVHVVRTVWKNLLTLAHNVVILPFVFIVLGHSITWTAVLALPAMVLVVLSMGWMGAVLGFYSARFRDLPPIMTSLVTVAFYLTPVMWYPSLIGNNQLAHVLLGFNPLYHLMQIVRLPLLGDLPTLENWFVAISFAMIGALLTFLMLRKTQNKIAYWV